MNYPVYKTKFKLLGLGLLVSAFSAHAQQTPTLIDEYCTKCHNFEDWAGGLDLGSLDFEHVEGEPEIWEDVIRKVRAGMMPPSGEERPDREHMDAFARTLENKLDQNVVSVPAAPALHRLNRTEYANAIRDILKLDIDVSALLPQDDSSEGFDNIASGLGFSPALIQGYTSAAMKVSRWAVGDMTATESSSTYNAPPNLSQEKHLDGMPLGTRGGIKVTHTFPLDAEYSFNVRGGLGFPRNANAVIDITFDGKPLTVDNTRSFTMPVTAGQHTMTVAIVDQKISAGVNDIYSAYSLSGAINTLEIAGPFNATGPGNTVSREQIFSCYPATNDEETACAEKIVAEVATQAFRTPITTDEIAPMMTFYQQGYKEEGFEGGIQQALSRIFIDPRFLFRFEEEPVDVAPGEFYQISDLELATRLSFFLWSSIPDNELLSLAEKNELSNPDILSTQVKRMLSDPKANALVENFAGQWLHLRELNGVTPESPDFDDNLRMAFIEETSLLLSYVINEDRPVTELLDADYTFLNERLATHYDIDNIRGSYFRKVPLPEASPRRGILGHGSILTITSTASRTSPVIRGSWILENLLSAPVPAPPPGVETNLDGDGSVVLSNSVRERLEAHRVDPSCSSCHSIIDPVGFSLENFDMVGAWREYDGDSPVDATGILVDGTPVASPVDLRNALMGRSDLFVTTMTEKMLTYALGRGLEYYDMPTVRSILREAEQQDYRFSALVEGIVNSEQFKMRVKSTPANTAAL